MGGDQWQRERRRHRAILRTHGWLAKSYRVVIPEVKGLRGSTYSFGLATLGGVNVQLDRLARLVTVNDLCGQLKVDALLLQDLLGLLGDLGVHAGAADLVQELDDGDLGAQAGPDRGHLEANDTATNDDKLLRDLLQGDGAGAGDDALLVDLQAGKRCGLGASGDEDVLADDARLAAVVELDLDLVLVDEGALALEVLDAVLLEEKLDALGEAGDGGVLGLHQLGEVQLDVVDLDTPVLCVVEDLVVEMRVVEEGF